MSNDKLWLYLNIRIKPELKDLAWAEAEAEGISLNEWAVRVLAERLKRRDLSTVPRKSGRRQRA